MIENPFRKNFRVSNKKAAVAFLIAHVPKFKDAIEIMPNLISTGDRAYSVHAYCDSLDAMVGTPNTDNALRNLGMPVIMVSKPYKENRIIAYEILEPRLLVGNNVSWQFVSKVADVVHTINLETGEYREYDRNMPEVQRYW